MCLIYLNQAAPIVGCAISSRMCIEVSSSVGTPCDAEVVSLLFVEVSEKRKFIDL